MDVMIDNIHSNLDAFINFPLNKKVRIILRDAILFKVYDELRLFVRDDKVHKGIKTKDLEKRMININTIFKTIDGLDITDLLTKFVSSILYLTKELCVTPKSARIRKSRKKIIYKYISRLAEKYKCKDYKTKCVEYLGIGIESYIKFLEKLSKGTDSDWDEQPEFIMEYYDFLKKCIIHTPDIKLEIEKDIGLVKTKEQFDKECANLLKS